MRTHSLLLLALLLSACWQQGRTGPVFEARTGIVYDGDSFLVKRGRNEIEIRLYGIDAPERSQPWADEARTALEALIGQRMLRIEVVEQDRYDRAVARVYLPGKNLYVNEAMVARGHAWAYRRYTADRALVQLEERARRQRIGLWRLPRRDRVPPWEWRETQEEQ